MQASEEVVDPVHGLARNALGLPQVLFCIVTGAAPIAAMLFNDPWAVFGGGWAAPSAFIIATIGFTLFSVGYVAMARRVTAAGGFYSFVSHGFGQTAGHGHGAPHRGLLLIFSAGVTGVTAYFANATINDWFGCRHPGLGDQFGTLAVMIVLAFFHIELTAKILGVFLVLELIALLVVRHRVALPAGQTGYVSSALLPWNFFDGDANGAVKALRRRHARSRDLRSLLVMDRLRDGAELRRGVARPEAHHVPATYISVIGLGVLYTFICWMLVVVWGKNGITAGVNAQFNGDIASVFYPQTDRVFPIDIGSASLLTRLFQLTIVTGSFACQLAFFNTATRYLFSMGREGILPRQLGRTHPKHHSPYVAAHRGRRACRALIIAGFLLYDSSTLGALLVARHLGADDGQHRDPGHHGPRLARDHPVLRDRGARDELHWFSTIVAPLLAAGVMAFAATYLLIDNRTTLASGGTGVPFVEYMWVPPLLVFIVGIVLALLYRSRDRARYEGIGRYLHEDIGTVATTAQVAGRRNGRRPATRAAS